MLNKSFTFQLNFSHRFGFMNSYSWLYLTVWQAYIMYTINKCIFTCISNTEPGGGGYSGRVTSRVPKKARPGQVSRLVYRVSKSLQFSYRVSNFTFQSLISLFICNFCFTWLLDLLMVKHCTTLQNLDNNVIHTARS